MNETKVATNEQGLYTVKDPINRSPCSSLVKGTEKPTGRDPNLGPSDPSKGFRVGSSPSRWDVPHPDALAATCPTDGNHTIGLPTHVDPSMPNLSDADICPLTCLSGKPGLMGLTCRKKITWAVLWTGPDLWVVLIIIRSLLNVLNFWMRRLR